MVKGFLDYKIVKKIFNWIVLYYNLFKLVWYNWWNKYFFGFLFFDLFFLFFFSKLFGDK